MVLAGGPVGDLEPESGECPAGKGMILVGGQPLASRALQAVRACSRVSRVVVVSPVGVEAMQGPEWASMDATVQSAERLMDSFCRGVESVSDPRLPVLVCCGDMPFVSAEAVDDFVERCATRPEASIWYGFLRRETSERGFPGVRHTWARLHDGTFCGTGLMMLRPSVVTPVRAAMESLTRARKNMVKLASCLGWGTVLAYVLGRLTVTMAEGAGTRIFGVPCAGVESPFAELGFNIDDNQSLRQARQLLQRSSS